MKFILSVLILSFIAYSSAFVRRSALPISFPKEIPAEFKEFVPEEVTKFYSELTDEDKNVLKEIAANHAQYENEEQALEALKAKSEKLYTKANELRQLVKGKIDALNADAKAFINGIIEKLRALKPKGDEKPNLGELRKQATEIIEQYKALSEEAKESLKANFPKITSVVQNEKFQKLAQSLLKPEGAPAA